MPRVNGSVPASKLVKPSSAKTVDRARVKIRVRGGSFFVSCAQVTEIKARTGITHAIKGVLMLSGA